MPDEVEDFSHPYLKKAGTIYSGSEIYRIEDVEQKDTIAVEMTKWEEGTVLPTAVVTKFEYKRLTMPKSSYDFYQIKREYVKELNTLELGESLMRKIEEEQSGTGDGSLELMSAIYNLPAYEKFYPAYEDVYLNMKFFLIAVGIFAMGYLMAAYLARRKEEYYKLREIGASAMQVQKLAIFECLYGAFSAAKKEFMFQYEIPYSWSVIYLVIMMIIMICLHCVGEEKKAENYITGWKE